MSVLHFSLIIETLVFRWAETGRLVFAVNRLLLCGGQPRFNQICGIRKTAKRIQNDGFVGSFSAAFGKVLQGRWSRSGVSPYSRRARRI